MPFLSGVVGKALIRALKGVGAQGTGKEIRNRLKFNSKVAHSRSNSASRPTLT